MQPKTMIVLAIILMLVSLVVLSNRRGIIDALYNDAAEQLRAKIDQPDYDQDVLQQEARAIEVRVVRTDEMLLYGGIMLGLLGLVFLHAALVQPRFIEVTQHEQTQPVAVAPVPQPPTEEIAATTAEPAYSGDDNEETQENA